MTFGFERLGSGDMAIVQRLIGTPVRYPADQTLVSLLEAQVRQRPDSPAVAFEGERLTYAELDRKANQVAHLLVRQGVRVGQFVGLLSDRHLHLAVGLVGILKAGAAYLPLEADYPVSRLAHMVADTEVQVLLASRATLPLAMQLVRERSRSLVVICLDGPDELAQQPTTRCEVSVTPSDLAYITYTSGSTGRPKGVPVAHRNIVPLMLWARERCAFGPGDRIAQLNALSFDFSVWEIFTSLTTGACLHLVPEGIRYDDQALADLIHTYGLTVLNITPSQFSSMLENVLRGRPDRLRSLRLLILGAERIPAALIERTRQFLSPTCALGNAYGPSECTILSAFFKLEGGERLDPGLATFPIGSPVANARLYVVDHEGQLVPPGERGELYVGGSGVIEGYLNLPERTAGAFLPDPWHPGGQLYRSGDQVRLLADGDLEFIGRQDNQVKVGEFRIELGEIEAALHEHPAVRDAAVVVRSGSESESNSLVAYVTVADSVPSPTADELERWLRERLPAHMIPKRYAVIDRMPLSPNGKLDQRALPDL